MSNPVGSFIWYELMTTDPDGAAAFYGAVVGWTILSPPGPQGTGMDYRMIARDDGGSAGGVLGLSPEMTAQGARPGWFGYLHVPDVDATARAIEADGGKVTLPPFDLPVGRIAMVTDPQGVPFYVMAPKPPPGMEGMASDVYDRYAPQRVAWNELYSPDLEAAKAFYARHFHFAFNESMPMGEMGDYCFIDHGGQQIGAAMQKPAHVPAGTWQFYIRVPAIEPAIARAQGAGGRILSGPMEVPGGEWIANGVDPQGAAFSLVAAKRSQG